MIYIKTKLHKIFLGIVGLFKLVYDWNFCNQIKFVVTIKFSSTSELEIFPKYVIYVLFIW